MTSSDPRRLVCGAVATAALVLAAGCQPEPTPFLPQYGTIDLVIENGRVLDGRGGPARDADVVVVDDTIVFVGESEFDAADRAARINRRIDAAGRAVTPGFIDLHSHGNPLETPDFENFLAMGVTTISLGQDGSSPEVDDLSGWLDEVRRAGRRHQRRDVRRARHPAHAGRHRPRPRSRAGRHGAAAEPARRRRWTTRSA
ncbi:MAG: hypothetical protein U5K76_01460 [Woeseiaceae bacterium]|nr:hypothetical protein [Woeseiaceae bacterium]